MMETMNGDKRKQNNGDNNEDHNNDGDNSGWRQ